MADPTKTNTSDTQSTVTPITLDTEQFDQLADSLKTHFDSSLQAALTKQNTQPPVSPDPVVTNPPAANPDSNSPLTLDALKGVLTDIISKTDNTSEMYETMFTQNLEQAVVSAPGLDKFIDAEDDFGQSRKERLMGIKDYKERVSALNQLTQAYAEASAGGSADRRAHVDVELEKKVAKRNDSYKDINDKYLNGEFTSNEEYLSQVFKVLEDEISSLST